MSGYRIFGLEHRTMPGRKILLDASKRYICGFIFAKVIRYNIAASWLYIFNPYTPLGGDNMRGRVT